MPPWHTRWAGAGSGPRGSARRGGGVQGGALRSNFFVLFYDLRFDPD